MQSRKRQRHKEQTSGQQSGEGMGWDELGDWDWYIHTIDIMYKIDNWWEPTVWHRKLCPKLCGDLNEKEIQLRGDTCICKADTFFSTAETDTAVWSSHVV